MPPSSRIPPLLQAYVRLPRDDSILLLTSTLGASANWLVIRFLCDALSSPPTTTTQDSDEEEHGGADVVLVSWMREYEFWRQEARKGGGLDLERLRREARFAFVDGLSTLFLPPPPPIERKEDEAERGSQGQAVGMVGRAGLPVRGPAPGRVGPVRGLAGTPAVAAAAAQTMTATAAISQAGSPSSTPGLYTLKSPDLAHLKATISSALMHIQSASSASTKRKTLLLLDNPDILLATVPSLSPSALTSTLLTLHTQASHILVHMQADTPLLSLSTPPQPLEVAQHNFLVKMAHMSRRILSVRVLDTGVARDVSGVLRVTENRESWVDLGFGGGKDEGKGEEQNRELLYLVKGDGSVRVFERGAGGEG
ncbi:hypothetical protein BU26DRAFT_544351 [Trematosphaeria pertusa]|uniref:Elongator complex protein 5 n=1 Tax=Trematosphaeria pertusa TaxID=390896 RepID=A0A6A6HUL1_9PLEO|nr:uncharacterized protein BU26DRAFT_544351 [Trematosphaeria pertusa]KAF2241865.1 hypothetical protein BU26DRAFT_544351 [Trematosphaeria pertusa]